MWDERRAGKMKLRRRGGEKRASTRWSYWGEQTVERFLPLNNWGNIWWIELNGKSKSLSLQKPQLFFRSRKWLKIFVRFEIAVGKKKVDNVTSGKRLYLKNIKTVLKMFIEWKLFRWLHVKKHYLLYRLLTIGKWTKLH